MLNDYAATRNDGMPLGGIGAGSLEIRPNGYFGNWWFMNNYPWGGGAETDAFDTYGLRFCLIFNDGGGLQAFNLGESLGVDTRKDKKYWLSDPYHFPWVAHPERVEFEARFPHARLNYHHSRMPIEVSLQASSLFVPHDYVHSNMPAAFLEFTIRNRSDKPMEIGLLSLMKNPVGYDHPELPAAASIIHQAGIHGMQLTRPGLPVDSSSQGSAGLFFLDEDADLSHVFHPRAGRDLWDPLMATGRLEDRDWGGDESVTGDVGAERSGKSAYGIPRAAICRHLRLRAGENRRLLMVLCWHFPVFTELTRPANPGGADCECTCSGIGRDIGHAYAQRYRDATDVARQLVPVHQSMMARTRRFADALYTSTLPGWETQAVGSALSLLLRTAWLDKAGEFGIWEGLGCCGLQTIDVGHYSSWPILQMFPDWDRSSNRLSVKNCTPEGKVPHLMQGSFIRTDEPSGGRRGRIDLPLQFIMAVWRYVRWTGDVAEAERLWPVLTRQITWIEACDLNNDGLPDNKGSDQTYDQFPIYGTGSFVAGLFIGALDAMQDLAGMLEQPTQQADYTLKMKTALQRYEAQLWNGRYYRLSNDISKDLVNEGCMTDQINADWFMRQSRGSDAGILPDERIRGAQRAILQHNSRRSLAGDWLCNCSWPEGGGVDIWRGSSDQVNCPWTGVEYAFAAHLRLMGLRDEGRRVAKDAFDRYELAGMRFNHLECGGYYYRSLAIWALYSAEFGINFNAIDGCLSLSLPTDEDCRFLLTLPQGSATVDWCASSRRLNLRGLTGRLEIRKLRINGKNHEVSAPLSVHPDQIWSQVLS